jgi:2-oxoglutarate ferredoxin oxidoreductase subunit beta
LAVTSGATFVARWTTQKPRRAIKSIKKALLHRGFSFVEIVCQCPTNFGRKALSTDDAVECLEWIKKNSITLRQAAEGLPETLENKFVLGEFVEMNRPVFAGSSVLDK